MTEKTKHKKNKSGWLLILFCIICLGITGYCGYRAYTIQKGYDDANSSYDEIRSEGVYHADSSVDVIDLYDGNEAEQTETTDYNENHNFSEASPLSVDFRAKRETDKISEIVGWIYCPDTPIDYPVVQHDDNMFYLTHGAQGQNSGSGAIYMNCYNYSNFSDRNNVLYGHHMNDNSMFCSLEKYMKQDYYEAHPVFYLNTAAGEQYRADVVSAFVLPADSCAYKIDFYNQLEWTEWVDWINEISRIDTVEHATVDDRFITMSTCAYSYYNSRSVVVCKLTLIGTDTSLAG